MAVQFNWPTFTSLVPCVGWWVGVVISRLHSGALSAWAFTMAKADNTACHGRILPVSSFANPVARLHAVLQRLFWNDSVIVSAAR